MPDPNFITSNPAVDEFNRANAVATQQQNADLEQQGKVLANKQAGLNLQTATAEAPSRLRALNAEASTAETQAQFAPAQARATIAAMNTRTAQVHMDNFYKSLSLLNQGDIPGAKAFAAQTGEQIPDAVVNDAQVRAAVTNVATRAQQLYPNRPKDQMTYIHSYIVNSIPPQGQMAPNDPRAPYMVQGAPTPPELGGVKNGETEQIISNIMAQNPSMSYADAVAAAHGRTQQTHIEEERLAQNAATKDPHYRTDPAGTLDNWRKQYGLPSNIPSGAGTKEQPYTPTSQQQVDWFKANAPAGSVLSVNGQLLTK